MDALLQLDRDFLLFLNSFHSPFWDNFFWIVTSITVWIPMYAAIAWVIFKRVGLQGIWALLAIVLTITLCDQVSSSFFKPFFERFRPSWEPALEGIVRLVNERRGGYYGFVSSHATNTFGLAILTSLLFRKSYFTIFIFSWAFIKSYSRIYMGLHYPGDMIGGIILGLTIGISVYYLYKWLTNKYTPLKEANVTPFGSETWQAVTAGVLSFLIILISSQLLLQLM